MNLCGAAQYAESVERDAEMEGTLRQNGETSFTSFLRIESRRISVGVSVFALKSFQYSWGPNKKKVIAAHETIVPGSIVGSNRHNYPAFRNPIA